MASTPGPVPTYQTVAATASRNGVKIASKCRSRKKSNPIAIATDRTAMPYRRIVGMVVGDEGSRCSMTCLIHEPARSTSALTVGQHNGTTAACDSSHGASPVHGEVPDRVALHDQPERNDERRCLQER